MSDAIAGPPPTREVAPAECMPGASHPSRADDQYAHLMVNLGVPGYLLHDVLTPFGGQLWFAGRRWRS